MCNIPKLDLFSINAYRNIGKLCQFVLKTFSVNEIMRDGHIDRKPKSSIVPLSIIDFNRFPHPGAWAQVPEAVKWYQLSKLVQI